MILESKVALVTGGTSGIGRATAIAFGGCFAPSPLVLPEHSLLFSGRRDQEGEETATLIRAAGAECLYVHSDVTSEADVKALVHKTIETYCPITQRS